MLNLRAPTVERFNRSGTGNDRLRPALLIVEKRRLQRLASCGLAAAFVKHECSERPYKGSNAFL